MKQERSLFWREPTSFPLFFSQDFQKLNCDFSSPKQDSVHTEAFRIFVVTWNVGGNPPHPGLDLNDFLPSDDHSDIYVLGYITLIIFLFNHFFVIFSLPLVVHKKLLVRIKN